MKKLLRTWWPLRKASLQSSETTPLLDIWLDSIDNCSRFSCWLLFQVFLSPTLDELSSTANAPRSNSVSFNFSRTFTGRLHYTTRLFALDLPGQQESSVTTICANIRIFKNSRYDSNYCVPMYNVKNCIFTEALHIYRSTEYAAHISDTWEYRVNVKHRLFDHFQIFVCAI